MFYSNTEPWPRSSEVLQTFDWVLVSGHDSPRTILKNQLRLCINNDVDVARGFNFSLKVYRATSIYLSKQARFEISIAQLRVLTTIIAIFNSWVDMMRWSWQSFSCQAMREQVPNDGSAHIVKCYDFIKSGAKSSTVMLLENNAMAKCTKTMAYRFVHMSSDFPWSETLIF